MLRHLESSACLGDKAFIGKISQEELLLVTEILKDRKRSSEVNKVRKKGKSVELQKKLNF